MQSGGCSQRARTFRRWVGLLSIVSVILAMPACHVPDPEHRFNQAERDRNYATFIAIAKVGLRFEDVRDRLAEAHLKCGEPYVQTKFGTDKVCFVRLTGWYSRMATLKESTGWAWLPDGKGWAGVIHLNSDGIIIAVK